MATPKQLDHAFQDFTNQVAEKARAVNVARERMQTMINRQTQDGIINTDGTIQGCNGASIRDYEERMEAFKKLIANTPSNPKLQYQLGGARHYIRALDVELVHRNRKKNYLITGVIVRGLISVSPNDGNQSPTYSSKSSSSSTPP